MVTGVLMYLFILMVTPAVVVVLPIVLTALVITSAHHRRMNSSLVVAVIIAAAFVTGGLFGWAFRPSEWKLGIAESFNAGFHSEIHGHESESKAERAVVYFFLLPGDVTSVAAGLAALAMRRRAATAP